MKTSPSNRIAMLFLAAGASRRMGRSKALLPWKGRTVIAHHAETLSPIPSVDPWIVTQPVDEPLVNELDSIPWPAEHRAVNPLAPECGMFKSIQCGIRSILDHPSSYTLIGIALTDQVLIQPSTYTQLFRQAEQHLDYIVQPAFQEQRGHPVILPRRIAEQIPSFTGDTFRQFLEAHNDVRKSVTVDDAGVVTDMDTPQAYQEQLLSV